MASTPKPRPRAAANFYKPESYHPDDSIAYLMRRVLDSPNVSLVSTGIRAISVEEVAFYEASRDRITIHWAKDQARWDIAEMVAPLKGRPVYLGLSGKTREFNGEAKCIAGC